MKDEFWFQILPKKKKNIMQILSYGVICSYPAGFFGTKHILVEVSRPNYQKEKQILEKLPLLNQTTTFSITIESKHIFDDQVTLS